MWEAAASSGVSKLDQRGEESEKLEDERARCGEV